MSILIQPPIFLLLLQLVAADERPFWIESIEKARLAGLRLERVRMELCGQRSVMMLHSVDEVGDLFEHDRVRALLELHSSVGIDARRLCTEIETPLIGASVEVHLMDSVEDERAKLVELLEENGKTRQQEQVRAPVPEEKAAPQTDKEGKSMPIGLDLEAMRPEGRAAVQRMLELKGDPDPDLDQMLSRMAAMARQGGVKPLPSSVLEPLLNQSKYDARSAPAFVEGSPVEVRVGIHVQSIANFQLATMDYDMDMWLRMSWRDPRLAQNLSTPILINDELFLRKIWRPDAFFVNARDALFHRVTRLNFYAFVFPRGGEVFMEARLYVKPKSQLVLCKYPHDRQTLLLRISSIASTMGSVQFRWFSQPKDAIRVHGQLQLPELYIAGMHNSECQSARKTGNFSCLEARFLMHRSIGYHLWQTYVPTATCVVFSWISVWLPEEFVEGRVFVALTVFLTLSAESSSAKETLPKVSYVKAIDVWFGFTAVFVFFTMLQALLVIGLEHLSARMRKIVTEQAGELSVLKATMLIWDSRRYHRLARGLDEFFKVMYPVIFLVFLFIYIFVVIEGDEGKCLQGDEQQLLGDTGTRNEL